MAAIVGGKHVRIAVQNGHAANAIGFDEIGNLSALITIDRPMVFIGWSALAPSIARGVGEVGMMDKAELIRPHASIVIGVRLAEPRH